MADERYTHTVQVYAQQQASLIEALLRALFGIWLPFTWWNRPDMVNAWAARSAVNADLAIVRSRRMARAFMIEQLRQLDALPDQIDAIDDMIYPRSGTPVIEVYKRPARQYEHALRQGKNEAEAREVFLERLTKIVTDDVVAAARDESMKVIAAAPKKVIGYRRVLHPERSRTGPCGLCIIAADRFYTRDDLMELHGECKCTVSPITEDDDPGLRLNRRDLDEIYAAAGSKYAEDLKRLRVRVQENGELGPILRWDGQHFRDVTEVNRDSKRQKFTPYEAPTRQATSISWDAMRASSERSIRILEDAKANGTNLVDMANTGRLVAVRDIDQAIAYHRALIARAAAHAA